jgi:CheY-like chemotaxis protein
METEDSNVILIVDDSRLDQHLLRAHLEPRGYTLDFAGDGIEAMEKLEAHPRRYDVVLLDRSMPKLGGIEVLKKIKEHPRLRALPVIMQTAWASREQVLEGIRAGAYYYLPKPYDAETVVAMVATASRDYSEYRRLQGELRRGLECLKLIETATLTVASIIQARDIAAVLANMCPDPSSAVVGLTELLVNAVEHGNLGITYEEKTALNASGMWEAEVARRLTLGENSWKRVEVRIERTSSELRFTIRDNGKGFPWREYLEVDPQRAFHNHGRGIAISRAFSFQALEYRGTGSEVVATVKL